MSNYLRRLDCGIGFLAFILQRVSWHTNLRFHEKHGAVKRILCIKLWGMGNLVVIFPLLEELKKIFPLAKVIFLTFDLNRELLENNVSVDKVVYFSYTKNVVLIVKQAVGLIAKFRNEDIDVVINFETFNNAAAIFTRLIKAPISAGLANRYEREFYTHPVTRSHSEHISQTFTRLLMPFGFRGEYRYFNFKSIPWNKDAVEELLKRRGITKYVCIHPGTSDNFKGKRYRKDYFGALAQLLIHDHGIHVVFTGSVAEKGLVSGIVSTIPDSDKVLNLAGQLPAGQFVELLRGSRVFIGNDSGPVHIAACLGINIAAFYGPTSPARYGPLNKNSLVFYMHSPCSPCIGQGYLNKKCRNNFKCLDFSPQKVVCRISERFFNG
jgi:ADP-heptose:LPS heptosyltransferase